MSTTFTCKRLANAFRDGEKILYILNEVTYDSNLYPHTKHIHVYALGELPEIMDAIFEAASNVEGGGLNSPDRALTPERYIKSWLNAIKKPYGLRFGPDQELNLDGYSWQKDRIEALKTAIAQRGSAPTLINHYDLVSSTRAFSALSRNFSDSGQPLDIEIDPALGYQPKKSAQAVLPNPGRFIHLPFSHGEYYVRLDDDGLSTIRPEWLYRIIGDYVGSLAKVEFSQPGAYKDLISSVRTRLQAMPCAEPKDVRCFLEPLADDHYGKKEVARLIDRYGTTFLLDTVDEDEIYYLYNHVKQLQFIGDLETTGKPAVSTETFTPTATLF